MKTLAALILLSLAGVAQAQTLTWTSLPTSTPNITISRGVFSSPVSFVSLEQGEDVSPYTTYLEAFNTSGQLVDFCLEYAGQGYIYQGPNLVSSSCVNSPTPNTYAFSFSDTSNDISQIIAGSYMPAGPVSDVTYGVISPVVSHATFGVPEPASLGLLLFGLIGLGLAGRPPRGGLEEGFWKVPEELDDILVLPSHP
jgi:hypothetical protein